MPPISKVCCGRRWRWALSRQRRARATPSRGRRSATMTNKRPGAAPVPDRVPQPERQVAFRLGISAESRAAAFLIAKGFRILARRWKSPVGEIDIIARRRQLMIFVAEKAREEREDFDLGGMNPPAA